MIFARLEQIMPNVTANEPFLFCKKCHTYHYWNPGAYCCVCGHKFIKPKEPQMITVKLEEEMMHEDAVKYVRSKVNWNGNEMETEKGEKHEQGRGTGTAEHAAE